MILGSVYYRVSDPGTLVVVGLHYTQPGPDAFFWAGERRVNGGCNDDNIASDSYSLHPGQVGSKLWQISDKDDILIKEHNHLEPVILYSRQWLLRHCQACTACLWWVTEGHNSQAALRSYCQVTYILSNCQVRNIWSDCQVTNILSNCQVTYILSNCQVRNIWSHC